MVSKRIILGISISLCVSCIAFADRTLSRAEILDIFDRLTDQPRKTWIPAGTIEAIHDEYRAAKTTNQGRINSQISQEIDEYRSNPNKRELTEELQEMKLDAIPFNVRYSLSNEYSMNSCVVLKYDGGRFYWEINVNSRTDSVTLPADLEGNSMTEQFNLDWNAGRIFTWDGQKYTFYSLPVNQAIVDTTGDFPHVVNGPLTAGIIPWGYGYFTYDNLSAGESSAVEVEMNSCTEIHLTLNNSDGSEMLFIMEPEKDYAVLSCLFSGRDSIVAKQYDNFKLVSGNWVPTTILVEQYEDLADKPLASDLWKFTNISGTTPTPDSFNIDYKSNALVEYRSSITQKPLMYHYTDAVDIERPMSGSLAFAASEGNSGMPQNCATVALRYAARQLGKEITNQQLTRLVSEPDKMTSLYAIKKFAQSLGFHSRVVKADLETLKNLSGCKAILHIPARNHFVLLDHIDNQYVWIFDLTSNNFFYSTNIKLFDRDWTEGTALLISKTPIKLQGNSTEIADAQLHQFVGAEAYTCTLLLQRYDVIYCDYVGGLCGGFFEIYFTRYGCEPAESGNCTNSILVRHVSTPCINDPYYPMHCNVTGEWTWYYMWACE